MPARPRLATIRASVGSSLATRSRSRTALDEPTKSAWSGRVAAAIACATWSPVTTGHASMVSIASIDRVRPASAHSYSQAGSSAPLTVTAPTPVSYTHLRAHETRHDLVCRLLL